MRNFRITRAIGAEFLRRKFKFVLMLFIAIAIITIAILFWLVNMNAWWWIFAVPMIVFLVLGVIILLIARVLVRIVQPELSTDQRTAVIAFVDRLESVTETVQTPPFMIFFYILKDTLRPRETTFIAMVIEDSVTLRPEFKVLKNHFK